MIIKGFNFKSNKIFSIILIAIIIAIILILVSFYLVHLNYKEKTKVDILDILDKKNILNAKSYIAEYSLNIVSNKNQNNYDIKEMYENNEGNESFVFEIKNNNDIIYYKLKDNNLEISSTSQLNTFKLENYAIDKKNLFSLSTFIEIFKLVESNENQNNFAKISIEYNDNKIYYSILFDNENKDKINTDVYNNYISILSDGVIVSKLELSIDKETLKPLEYRVFDDKGSSYINILFKNITINV